MTDKTPAQLVPDRIWLQWHGDADPEYEMGEVSEGDVSWCRDKIFQYDVEYVRADLAGPSLNQAIQIVEQYRGNYASPMCASEAYHLAAAEQILIQLRAAGESTQPEPQPSVPSFIVRRLKQEIDSAINFKGMSAGSPKVQVPISDAQYILKVLEALAPERAEKELRDGR